MRDERVDRSSAYLSASRTFPDHRFRDVFFDKFTHFKFHSFFYFIASQWNMIRFVAQPENDTRSQSRSTVNALPACFFHTLWIQTSKHLVVGIVDNNGVRAIPATLESIDFR